jgi:hypothetical protein
VIRLQLWQAALLAVTLGAAATLITVWWRQQSYRWGLVLAFCLITAPLLSWWSGRAFEVADYRAGCDGLCAGFRGAPIPFFTGRAGGGKFLPAMFALNSLVYLVILLAWTAIIRALALRIEGASARHASARGALIALLVFLPAALAPLILPPPEAHVRGDPQRIAINARREVYMYDQFASLPVVRVGLDDVRPRRDDLPGMRVCLRTYTLFYLPTGFMVLDMAPEGVHSTQGGVLPLSDSCWD